MSEITLTASQLAAAAIILWNKGQFRSDHTTDDNPLTVYTIYCDEDDVEEYLSEAGLFSKSDDYLSDASLEKLWNVRVKPVFVWDNP